MLIANSAWAEWKFVAEGLNGTTVYLDYESIKANKGSVYAWSLWDYKDANPAQSIVSFVEYKCEVPSKFRSLALRSYDVPMANKMMPIETNDETGEWKYPAPGTAFERVALIVCKEANASQVLSYFVFNTGRKVTSKKSGKLVYQQIKRTGFDTKKEAELAYIELKTKYNLGGNDSKQTFDLFVEEWFELFKLNDTRGKKLSKRTEGGYRNILDNHLIPYFGHMPVKSITPHDVNLFVNQQPLKGLSKRTVQSHYRLLSTITDDIVLRGFLPRNIVSDTKCPVPDKKSKAELDAQVLNKREQGLLIKQVNHELENSPDYYTLLDILVLLIGCIQFLI